ncbi:hypothetical protein G7Y89_g402 [Cudoniella acicularis]|uniref:Uncharacterized protein n=1 Tax=Cudoniella acicularis TaxID=354080 RepID=A0A8H4RZ93_9HELO|nr:hypothetical protein G7Y89_g402 [Cudoniella acicularis]
MSIPASSSINEESVPDYIANFHDIRGWYYARTKTQFSWRSWGDESRPVRLYYPASLQYNTHDNNGAINDMNGALDGVGYYAIGGMGRQIRGDQPYACTINPSSGKFERLCVQTRDSFCTLDNSTWDRTVIRNTAPRLFRLANFPLQGIPLGKRYQIEEWTRKDWISVVVRWIPASLGIAILLFLPGHGQPSGKNPRAYLPFLYNGYRYPRLARNFWENRREIQEGRADDPSWTSGNIGVYRAFRPRFLCYLTEGKRDKNGNRVGPPQFENDYTRYVFISYTKTQFDSDSEEEKGANYQLLYAMALWETFIYANSVQDHTRKPEAFWVANLCQPQSKYIEKEDRVEAVQDADEKKLLTDQDVYTMSDIIRGADHLIIIARNATSLVADDPNTQAKVLRGWGRRVWTLNEVILSKGDSVTISTQLNKRSQISKVRLAETAWPDADYSRQLVEHFTNLPLSRLELVSVAMKCLDNRELESLYEGDKSYALMGLLRVRPRIDTSDSSFQAFARLSLPQDSDRLMERLICLLPENLEEPWNRMSDKYKSILWDIFPHVQVCGIGENDTVFVDGFKGAMIQWSSFSTVQTMKRLSWKRKTLIYITIFSPLLLIIGGISFLTSHAAAIFLIVVSSAVLLAAPAYVPLLYKGKLYAVEPCLFGIEGYVPLPEIEEKIFGAKMGRLKWSSYGSPLSRHRYRKRYREHFQDVEAGAGQPLLDRAVNDPHDPVYGYPVESVDPCSPCDSCINSLPTDRCKHFSYTSAEEKNKSLYGDMKLFTLIDTFSMTATLFEARHPPVALIIGGSEGGMKRALACSYDITTGTLYRETVLRVPSQIVDKMHSLQRVRLGLKNPFGASSVNKVHHAQPKPAVPVVHRPPPINQPQNEEESSCSLHGEDGIVLEQICDGPVGNKVE